MNYCFDMLFYKDGNVNAVGWAIPTDTKNTVEPLIYDQDGKLVPCTFLHTRRPDVGMTLFNDRKLDLFGTYLQIPVNNGNPLKVVFREIEEGKEEPVDTLETQIDVQKLMDQEKYEKSLRFKIESFFKSEDKKAFFRKAKNKLLDEDNKNYQLWYEAHKATEEELREQKVHQFDYAPLVSIVVPAYNTPIPYLKQMVASVKAQTYSNWQLCIANGSGMNAELCRALQRYADQDPRIKWARLKENRGISGNTNVALKLADGEIIVLMDHDDMIAPNALYEVVAAFNENPKTDAVYSDEDKFETKKSAHYDPHFKSDFNIDLLCCNNYICHLFAVRKSIAFEVGGFHSEYDGAQDHDFILRCVEKSRHVAHIPKILYSWRCHRNSTSENPESKLYAFEAGQKAIEAYYQRQGIPGTVKAGPLFGWYKTEFHLTEHPLVSVLIPTKDHIDDLETCVNSLLTKATYDNYELIIIENNSTEPSTFAYYKDLEKRDKRIKVVYWDGPFNYSAINNFGAKYASGEYYLLLNNDVELITPEIFESMLGYCMREDVGIVGAKLFYPDNTIQHAGVLVGAGGVADHVFKNMDMYEPGYMGRAISSQDMTCVTGACLMIKKSVFEEVGGLTEEFAVAYNDVDLCLKVIETGKLVVFDAFVSLYHYESKSRGYEDTPEKLMRFSKEMELLSTRWDHRLDGDPYYNKNLSLVNGYYKLEKVKEEGKEEV
ncbi:MAG: glycosyltransferase family 2 protein [Lachnospiraceae bacterium]|nr:glycosyltransferase family 2 protein [Lachnospiraceae bacterium]